MPPNMNVFRILGDLSHTASKGTLIYAIHSNRSAEGVSLLTQLLYTLVFATRYLDLLWVPPWWSWWNFVLKLFYLASSCYTVFLMMRVYARTRERETAWRLAASCLVFALVAAGPVCLLAKRWTGTTISELLWTFSIVLESVCVLPQLLLLRQTSVPTVLDSFYLVALGSYRFFYILNWIQRGAVEHKFEPVSVVFGVVQTALYVDFAWVYWSRQRVKLRGGGVVDGDDLSKSFLVRRLIGRKSTSEEDDMPAEDAALSRQESGVVPPSAPKNGRSWGARGISVSADDTLLEASGHAKGAYADDHAEADAHMVDPAHFEDDDPVEIEDVGTAAKSTMPPAEDEHVVNSAGEWQENTGRKS